MKTLTNVKDRKIPLTSSLYLSTVQAISEYAARENIKQGEAIERAINLLLSGDKKK